MIDISVVIPTYNNLDLAKIAVGSVLRQENCSFELIIVDDSSNDDIESWVQGIVFPCEYTYIHNNPSLGAVNNWNYGLSLTKGLNVILLHHDEEFVDPHYLESVVKLLNRYECVIFNKQVFIKGHPKKDIVPAIIKQIIIHNKSLLFSCNVIGPTACVALSKDNLVLFDNRLQWKVDTEWYYRVLKKCRKIKYHKDIKIVSHHGHPYQITDSLEVKKVEKKDVDIINNKYHSLKIHLCLYLGLVLDSIKKLWH